MLKFKIGELVVAVDWKYSDAGPHLHHGKVVGLNACKYTPNPDPDRYDHTNEPWVSVEVGPGDIVELPQRYVFGTGSEAADYIGLEARRRIEQLEKVVANPHIADFGVGERSILVIWTYYHAQPHLFAGQLAGPNEFKYTLHILNPDSGQYETESSVSVQVGPGCTTEFPQRHVFGAKLETVEFVRGEARRRIEQIEKVAANPLGGE